MLLTFTLAAASLASPLGPTPLSTPVELEAPAGDKKKDDVGESVRLVTGDRVALAASYFPPRSRSGDKSPAALLVHDAGSDRSQLVELALYLQRKGFGVLALDLRGHGESATEDFSWDSMDDSARQSAWAFANRDIEAAASNLLERREIHSANLSLIGVGAGGGLILRHAYDDEAARAVALVAPPEQAMGVHLGDGITDLGGLPCLILVSREDRDRAEEMQARSHAGNGDYEYVDVEVLRDASDEILTGRELPKDLARWLRKVVGESG